MSEKCRWCGMIHGPTCPTVKSIEYFADGITVKRVEFKTAQDFLSSVYQQPSVYPQPWPPQSPFIPWGIGGQVGAHSPDYFLPAM